MVKPTLLILAAGMGSRYGGLKQVDPVGPNGEAIIDYSIYDAIRAGFGKVVFVIRESFAEAFKNTFDAKLKGKIEVDYVFQEINTVPEGVKVAANREKPWGTGHAVMVAKEIIDGPFAVINADDFYGPNAYNQLSSFFSSTPNNYTPYYCMVGYELQHTLSDHGHVSRGVCETDENGFLLSVVERTQIERKEEEIISYIDDGSQLVLTGQEVVSMNVWGFSTSYFEFLDTYFRKFASEHGLDPKSEF